MIPLENILFKTIEDHTIVWFSANNQYAVVENETADILQKRAHGIPRRDIALAISEKLVVPQKEVLDFIIELEELFFSEQNSDIHQTSNDFSEVSKPTKFDFTDYYLINKTAFKVSFSSHKERELIHPKFEHLSIAKTEKIHHNFDVFIADNVIYLLVDKKFIGAWNSKDVHYFQGKFSMELIQKIHRKDEEKWLGVFHASAVSDGKSSILFLGDSGNGKSTSLALLQANGFTCLADDFVPIAAENKEVYSFPAAISIKKNSLQVLDSLYPNLATATEYDYTRLNKIVRYLPPNNTDFRTHLPCKKLVFIKYKKEADLQLSSISKTAAFQQLVPDSWLSPIKKNAAIFLEWFEMLDCYEIIYSDNEKMIATVKKLFEDVL